MDVDETGKVERCEAKLPFSIENLLADKISAPSEVFREFDDGASDCSEQVDVEGSTADAQDFVEVKNDYQQPGNILRLKIDSFNSEIGQYDYLLGLKNTRIFVFFPAPSR